MFRYLKHHWLEVLICIVIACLVILFATGCTSVRLPSPGIPQGASGPSGILSRLAIAVTAIAGLAIILAGVAAWFLPNKWLCGKIAIAAIGAIVCCQALFWLSAHLVLCTVVCLICLLVCGIGWIFVGKIEKKLGININSNPVIGK